MVTVVASNDLDLVESQLRALLRPDTHRRQAVEEKIAMELEHAFYQATLAGTLQDNGRITIR